MAATDDDLLLEMISARIAGHERSQQTLIGPSGLGTRCPRKLAYRLAEHPPTNPDDEPPWRPTVGTAVHTWLAAMLEAANAHELASGIHSSVPSRCKVSWCRGRDTGEHTPRWRVELRLPCGTINGTIIHGNLDVYDALTATVLDWKIVGPTSLRDYRRADHPGEEYRTQIHVYGRGLTRALHLPVEHVAILFLPMNGELREAWYWSEPYDPEVGKAAFARAREIHGRITERGLEYIAKLKRVEDYCGRCPWFDPNTPPGEWRSCRGAEALHARPVDTMDDIL